MRALIDTSSLFKKYVEEIGSEKIEQILEELSEVAVSPVTWMELNAIIARRLREKSVTSQQALWLKSQAHKDFQSFHRVVWNESLEKTAVQLIEQHSLSTLDAIQLASAKLAKTRQLVTSDHALARAAQKEVAQVMVI